MALCVDRWRPPKCSSRNKLLSSAPFVFGHIVEAVHDRPAVSFLQLGSEIMLGAQDGVEESAYADRRRVRLLVTVTAIVLSSTAQ